MSDLIERLRNRYGTGGVYAFINPDGPEAADQLEAQQAEIARLKAELGRLDAALTPSAETKYIHMGEYKFTEGLPEYHDEDGDSYPPEPAYVPWTTVKEIMARIKSSAAGLIPVLEQKP